MKTYRIAAIPGDGIGGEVMDAAVEALRALGVATKRRMVARAGKRKGVRVWSL